jgi:osmotically-inducible protein OsmY
MRDDQTDRDSTYSTQDSEQNYGQRSQRNDKGYGKSYRGDDYYGAGSSGNSGRSTPSDQYQNSRSQNPQDFGGSYGEGSSFDSDRGSSPMMNNFSNSRHPGTGYNENLRSRERTSQYQPESDWNKTGRESGFGQSNQRDQSYGQQYGQQYTRGSTNQYYNERESRPYGFGSSRADQGTYGRGDRGFSQGDRNDSRLEYGFEGRHPQEFQGWDNQGSNYRGNDAQQSVYGSAGFGSLGTGSSSSYGSGYGSGYGAGSSYGSSMRQEFNPGSSSFAGHGGPYSGKQTPASYYGKGPKSFKRSDERIKEELSELYTRHHDIDASDIELEVKDGEVTLSGSVPERRMKYLAEELAENSMGVREVNNQIRVKRENAALDLLNSESDRGDKKTQGNGKRGGPGSVNNPNH